jgi:hypothetical protein
MELVKLLSLILLPFLLPALCLLASLALRDKTKHPSKTNYSYNFFVLKANRGLHAQVLFWLTLAIPFTGFLVSGAYSWQGYDLSINYLGFTEFIKISKLPLGILALCLPLAVLIARLHSTIQTAEQIDISHGTALRDQLKLNTEQFNNAQKHFIELTNKAWTANPEALTKSFDDLKFNSKSLFFMVFNNSNTRTGLVPCNQKYIDSLDHIQEMFTGIMKGSEWKSNDALIISYLASLGISSSSQDITKKDSDFFNYLVIFCEVIKKIVKNVESDHIG